MRQEQKFTLVKRMRRIRIVLLSVHARTHTCATALDLVFAQRLGCVVLGTPDDLQSPETE